MNEELKKRIDAGFSAALMECERKLEVREAEIKRLNEALVAAGKRIAHLERYERQSLADAVEYDAALERQRAEANEVCAGLQGRIDAALAILRTPGNWSDFAQQAIKALEGK